MAVGLATMPSVQAQESSLPGSRFRTLNLGTYYTQPFTNQWKRKPWSQLPRGLQTFDGIPFQIGGKLELTGLEAARHGDFKPSQVTGIPLQQQAEWIILLHGAIHGHKEGTPMANLVLHYANGQSHSFRLAYGIHTRNWIRHGSEKQGMPADPNSSLAWSSSSDDSETSLRFYRTTLKNPFPDQVIESVELNSLFGKASPIVFAITLDAQKGESALAEEMSRKSITQANAFPDSAYVSDLVVQVNASETSGPLTNATVSLTVINDETSFPFGKGMVDRQGQIRFRYPPRETTELRLLIQAPGRVPELLAASRRDVGGLRGEMRAALAQGVTAGGIVRSRSGPPVPGAEVLIYTLTQTASNEITHTGMEVLTTDDAGQWSSTCLPPGFTNVHLRFTHPEYKIVDYAQDPSVSNRFQVTREALLSNQAAFEMEPRIHLAGQVLDPRGRAISDAELFYRGPDRPRQKLRTDANGRFSLFINEEGTATMAFLTEGFAAQNRTLELAVGMKPLKIVLQKGTPLKGRVADEAGKPIEGATISLESWNTTHLVQWRTQTDAKGAFMWTNAPTGGFTFYVSKDNFNSRTVAAAAPSQREFSITLKKPFHISGQVLDANTREPLQTFDITRGQQFVAMEPPRWERGGAYRFKRGQFTMSANDLSGTPVRLLVEAQGYLPSASEPMLTAGLYTNDFLLKKGNGLQGKVLLPNGNAAAKAMVLLAGQGDEVKLDYPTEFRRGYGSGLSGYTRADGGFTLNPRLGGEMLFAAHSLGFGKAKAEEIAKTGQMTLQPWGKINGTLIQTGQPSANVFLALHNLEHDFPAAGEVPFSFFLRTRPDAKGRFAFDKVPPGEWKISVHYRLHENAGGPPGLSHGFPVTLRAGETNVVDFALSGRSIIGKVQANGEVDWLREPHLLTLQVPGTPNFSVPNLTGSKSNLEREELIRQSLQKERAFWTSKKGDAVRHAQRSYLLLFETNGTFRVDNVPPGNYELRIAPTDPKAERYTNDPMGTLVKKVVISDKNRVEPIDLGILNLELKPSLRIGATPPALEVKAPNGHILRPSDFRGKILLLDFWSLWSETRTSNLEAIRNLLELSDLKEKLAVLSISLDEDQAALEAYVRDSQMIWTNTQLPRSQRSKTLAAWDLDAIGGIILIGPDGRIASKPVQSDYLRSAVRKLLPGRN
jgi:hypothetical protein